MINVRQFRQYVIEPTLQKIGLYSAAAAELVLGTAIQESRLTHLKQLGDGPALGVCQMEPATHDDIWENYLKYHGDLSDKVLLITLTGGTDDLITNLAYAVAMCRVHYYRRPEALPQAGDLVGMANYWKDHYNTHLGKGTVDKYIENWEAYVEE